MRETLLRQLPCTAFGQLESVCTAIFYKRDWRIFADFPNYLILSVRQLYSGCGIPKVDIDNEVFALDSTTISVSINLCTWAQGKYSRGAVKMHALLNLRESMPEFILITDGKYHDGNALDIILPQPGSIYLMDKAYVDFETLFRIDQAEAFFVTRAKSSLRYEVIEQNFNIDRDTGLRTDKTIMLVVPESKKLWGYSPNAVRVHIWIAIRTCLIIAYVKVSLETNLSIYEIMQVLGVSAFDKTPIHELLLEQRQFYQNVNEQLNLFE